MPAYRVCGKSTPGAVIGARIVIANTSAQAVSFVAESLLSCENLGAQEVAELVTAGVPVVDARRPSAPPQSPTPAPPSGDMHMHKVGCLADPWTRIGGPGCRCTSLDMPATGEGIAS